MLYAMLMWISGNSQNLRAELLIKSRLQNELAENAVWDGADNVNDAQRLQDKLAKLGAAKENVSTDGREISASDQKGLLLAILNEFDETLMARLLVFRNKAGATVEFEVANRRLLRVAETSTQAMPDATLPGQVFTESGGPLVESLWEVLDKFLTGSEQIFVRSKRLEQAPDPTMIGCASETLAQAWSLDLYSPPESTSAGMIGKFIASCAEVATAWVQIEGGAVDQTSGPEDQVARLVEIARDALEDFDTGLNNHMRGSDAARCVTLGPQGETGDILLFAKTTTSSALVVLPDAQLADVISKWQSFQA